MRCYLMVILLLCVTSTLSKEICKVGDVDIGWFRYENKFKLNSSDRGIVVEEFKIENVTDSYFEDSKYLAVEIDDDKMKIKLMDEFKNYEKTESELQIGVAWHIECEADGKKKQFDLEYTQYILDENKYDPEFLQGSYFYEFYGELKRGFLLSDVVAVEARDWDISTYSLTYSITKNDAISIGGYNFKNKVGTAELATNRDIKAGFEEKYTIQVKDRMWEKGRSSSVPLTVIVKPWDETMEFEKPQYAAQLIGDQQLKFADEIRLKNGVDFDTKVEIRSDYIDYLAVSVDMLSYTINVKIIKPLLESKKYSSIELFLDAHWRGLNATTKVVISSQEPIKELCYVYGIDLEAKKNNGGWIKDNHTGVIKSYNTLNVKDISCTPNGTKYISCYFENGTLEISVTEEFKEYEKNEYSESIYLNMSITCTDNKIYTTEYVQNVDDINNHPPKFDSEKYSFVFYNQLPTNFQLTNVIPITVSDEDIGTDGFYADVEHKQGDYSNPYIGISAMNFHQKQADCKVYTKQEIRPGFDDDFMITVKDEMYSTTFRSSKAIISLKVIKDQDQVKFNHSEVNAIIKNDVIDSIELDNGFDYDTNFNIRSEYADYFEVVPNLLLNKIEIQAVRNVSTIPVDIVRIIVEAEWHNITDSVTIFLFMNGELPTTSTTSTTPEPEYHYVTGPSGMVGFKVWAKTLNITQVVVFTVAGVTLCGMAYVARRYYY